VDAALPVRPPSALETVLNRLFGRLVALGVVGDPFWLLEVRGRKTGRLHSTPVDVLEHAGRRYLVAPRGHTQWARNARASGSVTLRRGRLVRRCALRELGDAEKPEVLKAYLDEFRSRVQRFFAVPAGSPAEAFAPLAARHPAFEITEMVPGDRSE
jgi:deazaflavin-dependent oxidoreductase (nitroreductase family)